MLWNIPYAVRNIYYKKKSLYYKSSLSLTNFSIFSTIFPLYYELQKCNIMLNEILLHKTSAKGNTISKIKKIFQQGAEN